jgi:hypothetical protein
MFKKPHQRSFTILLGVFSLALMQTKPARAEAPEAVPTGRGYSYDFEDDALLGVNAAPFGGELRHRSPTLRVLLIRPRVHFVPELLEAVETL